MTSALASHPLTTQDRCDRCGAQAYIRVTMASGGELLFCAHHGHTYESKLREISVDFQDDSSQLVPSTPNTPDTER